MTVAAPRIIGRYALYGKIAAGGMATVHLGRLLGPVGFSRTVAIKRMHPHFTEDPEFVSMFLDEARLAARVRHPNVVPTLDVVATEGELFLVMEYVQGETMARLLRMGQAQGQRIPLPITGSLFSGVLHGLHAAHEAKNERGEPLGIVHRDVSPQNLIVGVDGVPRVLDFGVAKATGRLQVTREGQLKGKISYMAPEQVRGRPATRQTDIYAVAVVLWESLVGKRLFQDDNDAAVMQKILDAEVPPPSSLVPDLPRAYDAIVLRGLDREPTHRFTTAREMAAAIEALPPLAIPVQIGEWVENAAGPNLANQAARVAEIESASDASVATSEPSSASALIGRISAPPPSANPVSARTQAPAAPRRPPVTAAPAPAPVDPGNDPTTAFEDHGPIFDASDQTLVAEQPPMLEPGSDGAVRSQMSSISVETPQDAEPERRRSMRRIVGVSVGACALLFVVALVARAGRHSDSPSEDPSPPAQAAVAAAPAPPPVAAAAPPPVAAPAPQPLPPPPAAPAPPSPEPTVAAAAAVEPISTLVPAAPPPPPPSPPSRKASSSLPAAPAVPRAAAVAAPAPHPSPPAAPKPAPAPAPPKPKGNILFTNPG